MDFKSTRSVAALLNVRPGTLTRAVWEGRVKAPSKAPDGSFLWLPEDIQRASWALRRKPADDVLAGQQ